MQKVVMGRHGYGLCPSATFFYRRPNDGHAVFKDRRRRESEDQDGFYGGAIRTRGKFRLVRNLVKASRTRIDNQARGQTLFWFVA